MSTFDVSSNQLTSVVSEAHFSKLTKLMYLDLFSNSFTVNVNSNWIPTLQVQDLGMGSCILGPSFPTWLKFQKEVESLDFLDASISGSIPNWFVTSPLIWAPFDNVHLGFNLFEGPIPLTTVGIELLDLSHNYFSGSITQNLSQTMPYINICRSHVFSSYHRSFE